MKRAKYLFIIVSALLFFNLQAFAGVGDIVVKDKLSGSTDGKAIEITGTDSAGAVTVHTAVTGTTNFDEVWIWIFNAHTTSVTAYIEWGVHADADDLITKIIPNDSGLYLVIPGLVLQNAMTVEIFGSVANKLFIFGFVNELTGG